MTLKKYSGDNVVRNDKFESTLFEKLNDTNKSFFNSDSNDMKGLARSFARIFFNSLDNIYVSKMITSNFRLDSLSFNDSIGNYDLYDIMKLSRSAGYFYRSFLNGDEKIKYLVKNELRFIQKSYDYTKKELT